MVTIIYYMGKIVKSLILMKTKGAGDGFSTFSRPTNSLLPCLQPEGLLLLRHHHPHGGEGCWPARRRRIDLAGR
jgi:hypothetical protein